MRMKCLLLGATILLLVASASICSAQGPTAQQCCQKVELQNLCGAEFDNAYMLAMYQQHAEVAGLARFGAKRASSVDLQELSSKIVHENGDLNAKLALYYSRFRGCSISTARCESGSYNVAALSNCSICEFQRAYANAMIVLLERSECLANLGIARASRLELREQAKIVARASANEAAALQRWLMTGRTSFATQWEPLSEYCGISRPTPCAECDMFTP